MTQGQVKLPMMDLVYNDETGRYIAILERKTLKMTLDLLKALALLELLTGDNYADYDFGALDDEGELKKIATDALQRRLGISAEDSRKLVDERWEANNPPEPDPVTASFMIGPPAVTAKRHIAPTSAPIENGSPGYDVEKHLRGMEIAAKNREGSRDQL